jgi:D-lactate dehydrogenase (cytochrome)
MIEQITTTNRDTYAGLLRDESRSQGAAESISFPRNVDAVLEIVRQMGQRGEVITVQGARTGLTAGAVPHGGHVLNLSRMNRILGLRYDQKLDSFFLQVEPGVLLSELHNVLANESFDLAGWSTDSRQDLASFHKKGPFFFPPDPTETSASIGGMISCNASGARSFFYGPTRNYVQALTVVLMDGSLLRLQRGVQLVQRGHFAVRTEDGREICGTIPDYSMPKVKNASGYYLEPNMDLLDLFIGSEGTLGIVVAAELRLLPLPASIWGVTAFFPDENSALRMVKTVRDELLDNPLPPLPKPAAIEFFNQDALDLLRRQQQQNPGFAQMQPLSPKQQSAVYIELHAGSDEQNLDTLLALGEVIAACGGDEAETWVARNSRDLQQLQFFRHATPESVNMLIDERRKTHPTLTKLGTDMAVPNEHLEPIMQLYNRSLAAAGLESVIFGHIGNNHLHVNILPRNPEEYQLGKQLYLQWARQAVAWGGTVSAEHGIGKLKTAFLAEMYSTEELAKMRAIKRIFDPAGLLGRGNMFELEGQVQSR